MPTQFKPIRSLDERVSEIESKDGQFILTDTGNMYVDMPEDKRVFIRGASIPIVLTREQYNKLLAGESITMADGETISYEDDRIYMIKKYVE